MLLDSLSTRSETVSRFYFEMFHFQNFHMFGIIGSAIAVGILLVQMIKMMELKNVDGTKIVIRDKINPSQDT